MDCNMVEWCLKRGVEIPKFSTFDPTPLHQRKRPASTVIYADIDGTVKTDYVANWVNSENYVHSSACQLFTSRCVNISRDYVVLSTQANLQCEFCDNYTIHCAALFGDTNVMNVLVNRGADLDAVNDKGETALHLACSEGNTDMVNYLLGRGANPNIKDNSGTVPLHICLARCQPQTAESLLRYSAVADEFLCERLRLTPLIVAVEQRCHAMVNLLVAYGANVNSRDIYDQSPAYLAVKNADDTCLDMLIRNNASVNERYKKGRSLLHLACLIGNLRTIQLLLGAGAYSNAKDDSRRNALHLVSRSDNPHFIHWLIMYGCEINNLDHRNRSPLKMAILANQPDMVVCLLNYGACMKNIGSSLHKAIRHGFRNVAKILVHRGVNVNLQDRFNRTLLRMAVECADLDMVSFLLCHGGDPNARSDASSKPMVTEAILQGNAEMLSLLISWGADVCALDDMCKSPMFHAIRQKNLAVIRVMMETGITVIADETTTYLLANKEHFGPDFDLSSLIGDEPEDVTAREEMESCLFTEGFKI